MSWPGDGQPRFKVGCVAGFKVGGHFETGGSVRELTLWNVMDRAFNHEVVYQESPLARGMHRGEVNARTIAARLEAEGAAKGKAG